MWKSWLVFMAAVLRGAWWITQGVLRVLRRLLVEFGEIEAERAAKRGRSLHPGEPHDEYSIPSRSDRHH